MFVCSYVYNLYAYVFVCICALNVLVCMYVFVGMRDDALVCASICAHVCFMYVWAYRKHIRFCQAVVVIFLIKGGMIVVAPVNIIVVISTALALQ